MAVAKADVEDYWSGRPMRPSYQRRYAKLRAQYLDTCRRTALFVLLLTLSACANTAGSGDCTHWGDPFGVPDSIATVDVTFCIN
jgi:hypothetical protein